VLWNFICNYRTGWHSIPEDDLNSLSQHNRGGATMR
jgi:hypothetical protein